MIVIREDTALDFCYGLETPVVNQVLICQISKSNDRAISSSCLGRKSIWCLNGSEKTKFPIRLQGFASHCLLNRGKSEILKLPSSSNCNWGEKGPSLNLIKKDEGNHGLVPIGRLNYAESSHPFWNYEIGKSLIASWNIITWSNMPSFLCICNSARFFISFFMQSSTVHEKNELFLNHSWAVQLKNIKALNYFHIGGFIMCEFDQTYLEVRAWLCAKWHRAYVICELLP